MLTKEIKVLFSHSSVYGFGTVVSRFASFLLLPFYTHYLTPEDYGVLNIIDITSGLIGIIVAQGIAMALSRFYFEPDHLLERNRVVSTTYIIYISLALLAMPLLIFLTFPLSKTLFKSEVYISYLRISFISLLVAGLNDVGVTYLMLMKKSTLFVITSLTKLVLLILLNIIFIAYYKMGILGILYSSFIISTVYGVIMMIFILLKTKIRYSYVLAKNIIKYSVPIIPSRLAETLVKQSDRYFILHFFSTAEVGIYGLASKIGNSLHDLITIPFNMAYMPRRFEIMKEKEASRIFSGIFTYFMFTLIFLGLLISMFAPEILKVMASSDFFGAYKYIPLVVLYLIIFGTHRHLDFGILFSKKTKYFGYINISSALFSLVLNYFLIKFYGLWGALISYLLVVIYQAIFYFFVSNKFYVIEYEFSRIMKFLSMGVVIFLISIWINFNYFLFNIALKILLLMIFLLMVMILKIISKEEKNKLIQIINHPQIFNNKLVNLLFK